MKTGNILLIVVLFTIFSGSCKKDNFQMDSADLVGEWRSEKIELNGQSLAESNNWVNVSVILNLEEKDFFFKNYVSGSWYLKRDQLKLKPNDSLDLPTEKYKVLEVTETQLILEVSMTEGQYCCDFDSFEPDEIITITEHYKRVN